MISCSFYSRESKHNGLCALGWYGGKPFAGQCKKCLEEKANTKAAFDAAQEKWAKSHPEPFRGTVSNCCGRADQA